METCFHERDVAMAKSLVMLEEEFAFICERDGSNVMPVENSNYSYCAGNLKELLQNCSMLDWNELQNKTINTMTDLDCSIFQQLSTCFQNNITTCGAPLFAKLFNIRYQAILKQTPCKNNVTEIKQN
uniref:DUF19 domain-containing protein n=1 Tax=Anopheles farauti TaxID=69004 RepID=A0A182QS40_9DIPT